VEGRGAPAAPVPAPEAPMVVPEAQPTLAAAAPVRQLDPVMAGGEPSAAPADDQTIRELFWGED
jgi:hypothetical protein